MLHRELDEIQGFASGAPGSRASASHLTRTLSCNL
jgi:hypothetical protein